MMTSKTVLYQVLMLACMAFFLFFVMAAQADVDMTAPFPSSTASVATEEPDSLSCLAMPFHESELGSATPGVIQKIFVHRGDWVKKGQLLVSLQNAVDQASLHLHQAQVAYLKRVVARHKKLYEKHLLPAKDYDKITSQLKQARLQVIKQKAVLAEREIKSPFHGVVVDVYAEAGERVNDNKILKLAQVNPLLIRVVLPVSRYDQIYKGKKVSIRFDQNITQSPSQAKVWRFDKVIDAASGTFSVWLKLKNPDRKIPAGVRCHARLVSRS